MSRTQPTDIDWAELQFPCPTCDASRGEWCQAVRGDAAFMGNPARWLHVARWRAVREVIRLAGYDGYLDAQRAQARELRRQNVALRGGLTAIRGELEQITARWPNHLVAPQPLIDRIGQILTADKETP